MAEPYSNVLPSLRKPYPDFPLTPRKDGRWCKRINEKIFYFRGTWKEALNEYHRTLEWHKSGKTPPPSDLQTCFIRNICNGFLTPKKDLVESGELKQRTWNEYKSACRRVLRSSARHFRQKWLAQSSGPAGHDEVARTGRVRQ